MKTIDTDIVIIGAGTAGLAAFRNATADKNKKVLLIESKEYGTTCARVGCMPSKLLIAAANNLHETQKLESFGIESNLDLKINGKKVLQRIKKERDRFVGFVVKSTEEIDENLRIKGAAKFLTDTSLQIDENLIINFKTAVIATGSRPSFPPIWQKDLGDKLIVNDDIFALDDLPKSVIVMGPGVIGLELGQALFRLGVEVKVFGIDGNIAAISNSQIRDYAIKTFSDEFYLDVKAKINSIKLVNQKVEINYQSKENKQETFSADYLLAATGRRANVDDLGLENTSVKLNERSIPICDDYTMQTTAPNIFIAGDANNLKPLLHEAADQGKIAGDNARIYPNIKSGHRRSFISVVFSEPQIACVGENYAQLTKRLGDCSCFEIGIVSFEDQGRSRVMLENKGLLHIYARHGSGKFLGAEMIGPSAEHLAHLLAWAHQNQMTIPQMLEMPFYHPVIEEGLRTALRDVNAKLHLGPKGEERCLDCGPGC